MSLVSCLLYLKITRILHSLETSKLKQKIQLSFSTEMVNMFCVISWYFCNRLHKELLYIHAIHILLDIKVNGDSYSWSHHESVVSGDVVVYPVEEKTQTFKITIDGGRVSVVVNRNEGPVAGKYLGIYVVRVDGLSEHTTGIIG